MYCKNCGKEINDKAVICVHCGVQTENSTRPSYGAGVVNDVMTGGLVALCILIPLAGLIIGIVKQSNGAVESGGKCIKISIITWVICAIIAGISMAIAFS